MSFPPAGQPPALLAQTAGLTPFAQMIFQGADLTSAWSRLADRVTADPSDAGAMHDLAMLMQLTGRRQDGLALQAAALELSQVYCRAHGDGAGLRLLALVTPGDFMANTPLDFLLEGSDVTVTYLYLTAEAGLPSQIPDHDVAFLAIGESAANREVLQMLAPALAAWPRPLINGAADRIEALTRDGVVAMCATLPGVLAPAAVQIDAGQAFDIATGKTPLSRLLPGGRLPVIIRPLGSHAGQSLSKIDSLAELAAYLAQQPNCDFYLSQFIDYRDADGLYRKQRVAMIDGQPFISHMAVSEHWMVHYLNAQMNTRADRRAEEAAFMADFEDGFAQRHADAFAALHTAFGLDYFAIDCAELSDGRLLLFEADVAMIVHALDCPTLYPYKQAPMRKLFAGFQAHLAAVAGGQSGQAVRAA